MQRKLAKNFDKNNLHHAYLIEGARNEIIPEIVALAESFGIDTNANSDFSHMHFDSVGIDDARDLKALSSEKGYQNKRIFIISADNFTLDAQGALLKLFEEPIDNTHFFLIVPDKNALLKTLASRFYFISARSDLATSEAEEFLKMSLSKRVDFLKDLLSEPDEEDEDMPISDSTRSKALKFINALETIMHKDFLENSQMLQHLFKVREFLRMPGSSIKSLMESVALITPIL